MLRRSRRSSSAKGVIIDDPYRIAKFIPKHKAYFDQALREIQAGRKHGHWSWWIFPTPPYIGPDGIEQGSALNRQFALRDGRGSLCGFNAAKAYISFPETDGVNLRRNYLLIMDAVADALEVPSIMPLRSVYLLGMQDVPKVRSSLELFKSASGEGFDDEIHQVCERCLQLV